MMSPRNPKPSGRASRPAAGVGTETDLRRRPGGSRAERSSFLILCEGKTEKLYFTGLRTRRGPNLALDVPGCDHLGIVREAARRRTDEYDEVWCVLDTELDGALVCELTMEARKGDVELALSSPCFEVWLLLHHEECTAPFPSAKHAKRRLAQAVPAWTEARTRYADFKDGTADACERARALTGESDDSSRNPSTGVWRLVEKILGPPSR